MDRKKDIGERVKAIREGMKLTGEQFGNLLGMSKGGVSAIESGKNYPAMDTIFLIAELGSVSVQFLLTGKEEPTKQPLLKNTSAEMQVVKDSTPYYIEKERIIVATQDTSNNTTIPVINQKAAANYLSGFQSQEYFENLDSMTMPKFMVNGGQHGLFQVVGESMEPTFFDSEYVLCAKVEKSEWQYINDLEVFVVISQNNGVQLKRVKNRLKTKGFMRFRSDNRTHRDFSLNEDEILELWRFQWKLSPFAINRAEELYKKVDDMEEKMHDMEDIITLVMGKLNMPLPKHSAISKTIPKKSK